MIGVEDYHLGCTPVLPPDLIAPAKASNPS